MAKKHQEQLSPKKYILTRARALPILTTYINSNWKSSGMANIVVLREHKSGNVTSGIYLVDLYCKGVKDTYWYFNKPKDEIIKFIAQLELEECTYQLAHNIIFESLTFAEECGLSPHKEFTITEFILEDDESGDVEDLEIHCGNEDGVPLLIEQDYKKYKEDYKILLKTLGEGNFEFVSEIGDELEEGLSNPDENKIMDSLYPILMYKAIMQDQSDETKYLTNVLVESNLSLEDFNFDSDNVLYELDKCYEFDAEEDVILNVNKLIQNNLTPMEVLVLFDELIIYGNEYLLNNLYQKYKSTSEYDAITSLMHPFILDKAFSEGFDAKDKTPKNNALALIVYLIKKSLLITEYENVQEKEDIQFTIINLVGLEFLTGGILETLSEGLFNLKEEFVSKHIESINSVEYEKLQRLFEKEILLFNKELEMFNAD